MKTLITSLIIASLIPASGQALNIENRLNGEMLLASFEPVRKHIQETSAVIYAGREKLVYGTVVSPDGYILTKHSEIEGKSSLVIRIGRTKYDSVKVASVRKDWDLALLKIEASGLTVIDAASTSDISFGHWVVSNGATTRRERRIRVGVLSAKARPITGVLVAMGIAFEETKEGMRINEVSDKGGAKDAGLAKNDVLKSIDGKKLDKKKDVEDVLQSKVPGDIVEIIIQSGKEEKVLKMTLTDRSQVFGDEVTRNDQMSGRYSKRRTNFPRVIQHDIPLSRESVGGPVFTLDGKCIGMNIAVANRCESYAIPIEELMTVSKAMMNGL